jgi:hypothetical protein
MLTNIDPFTGNKTDDLPRHPFVVDGNVTNFFETEATRQEFPDMPTDHPYHLIDNATDEVARLVDRQIKADRTSEVAAGRKAA